MSDYGLITDLWRCCRPKVNYYGSFPSGFLLKARRLLGVPLSEPCLHVCGGRARDYSSPDYGIRKGVAQSGFGPYDRTLDLDPALKPDFLPDAREPFPPQRCEGCRGSVNGPGRIPLDRKTELHAACPVCGGAAERGPWPGVLIDRPYTEEDADHYAPGRDKLPPLNLLLKHGIAAVKVGGRIGVLDYLLPSVPAGAVMIAVVGVVVGGNNRIRCYSVFERSV